MQSRVRLSLLLASTLLQPVTSAGSAFAEEATTGTPVAGSTLLDTVYVFGPTADVGDKHSDSADRAQSIYISREEIEVIDPQSVRDLFQGDASVSVGGGIPIAQKVFVNGIDENNLAVTIDGVQQGNRIFHHTSTNYIDPVLLKAARVDPGIAPADAGFGALGGSIVYETVDVQDLLIGDRTYGAFSKLSFETNGSTWTTTNAAYARHQGFELLAYGKSSKGDTYENGDGFKTPGTAADFISLLGKAAYEFETGYRIEVTGQQVKDNALRPYRANMGGLNGSYTTRVYDTTRRNFSFNFGREEISGLWNPEAVFGYSENHFKIPSPYGSDATAGTLTGKIENVFELSEGNTLTTGVDLLAQNSHYQDATDDYREKLTNVGGYAQARLTPLERIKLSFGGRADQNSFEGKDGTNLENFGLSGNAFAEIDVYGGFSVNAGYSNVFGGIDLEENFEYWRSWAYSNLKPVRSDNVTAGVKYEHSGWFAEGNLFNTRFWNYRDGDGDVNFSSWGYNLAGGFNWGNGSAKLSFSDVRLNVVGTTLESYALINIGAGVGRKIAGEIVHTFDQYDLTLGASLEAALEYDGYGNAGYDPRDAYAVVNAYAEYNPEQAQFLTLRLDATNIFNETYSDTATYGAEYASVSPLYEPGRSFRLSANIRY